MKKETLNDGITVTKTTRYIGGLYEVEIAGATTKTTSYAKHPVT